MPATAESPTRTRGRYRTDGLGLKRSRRAGRTYYSVQVGIPKALQPAAGKKALWRYLGAVTESEAKRRAPAILVELQEELRQIAVTDRIMDIDLLGAPPDEWERARKGLDANDVPDEAITDKLIEDAIVKRIRREAAKGPKASSEAGSVQAVFDDWLGYKAATGRKTRSKERGERQRRKIAAEFIAFVGADTPFADIDHTHAQGFQAELLKRGLKAHTVDNKLSHIRGCFTDRRPGALNPFAGLTHSKEIYAEQGRARADFTNEQVQALFEASADDPRLCWLIKTAAYTGARLGELLALERQDFDFETGVIRFNAREAGKSAAARRSVPIHPAIAVGLKVYVGAAGSGPFKFGSATVGRKFKALQEAASATEGTFDGETYWLSFHSWRHGFKTRLLNAGVPTDTADILTGHARQGLNAVYGKRTDMNVLREAISRLSYGGVRVEHIRT